MVEFFFLFSFDFVIVSQRALNEHQQTYKDKQKGKTINCSVSPAVSPQLLRNSEVYRLYLNTSQHLISQNSFGTFCQFEQQPLRSLKDLQ